MATPERSQTVRCNRSLRSRSVRLLSDLGKHRLDVAGVRKPFASRLSRKNPDHVLDEHFARKPRTGPQTCLFRSGLLEGCPRVFGCGQALVQTCGRVRPQRRTFRRKYHREVVPPFAAVALRILCFGIVGYASGPLRFVPSLPFFQSSSRLWLCTARSLSELRVCLLSLGSQGEGGWVC